MGHDGWVTDIVRQPAHPARGATAPAYELADRYRAERGQVFVSGLQAIARLPVDLLRIDRRHGLTTAAFISGYQGSPVGMFGEEVARAARTVPDLPIHHQPGVNEELGATAVMGTAVPPNAGLSDPVDFQV